MQPGIKWNFYVSGEGINFLINFEFKWKQPAPKLSFFLFFFKTLLTKFCKSIFCVSALSYYFTYFWMFQLQILWSSFQNILRTDVFTKASVITKFFSDWFYMFNFHKINLKNDKCLLYMVWLLNSQRMKTLFFSARFLNMCTSRTIFHLLFLAGAPGLAFYESGPARLPSRLWMVNAGWSSSVRSVIFLRMKFIIFQVCLTKQAAFLPGQSTPYNQLLCQFCLFQNAI